MTLRSLLRRWPWHLLLLLAQPVLAQRDPLAEALALPHAGGLTGAKQVPLFAWVENRAGVRNLWVGGPGRPARRLTSFAEDDGRQLHGLALSDDGRLLAFVRGGDEEWPDEALPNAGAAPVAPPQQLFVVSTTGGAPELVGEGHSPAFAPGGERLAFLEGNEIRLWTRGAPPRRLARVKGSASRLLWSPDGARLAFVEDRGEHGYVALLDPTPTNGTEPRLRYLDPGLGHAAEPAFSPDGRELAFVRHMSPPPGTAPDVGAWWSIRVVDAASGGARVLWAAPPGPGGRWAGTRSRNLHWSRDGRILFPWERTGWLHVHALDAAKGGTPQPLTAGEYEVETFLLGPDDRALLYAANADEPDGRRVWRRGAAGAPVRLGAGAGDAIHSLPVVAGSAVAAVATDADSPAHPVLLGDRATPLAPPAAMPRAAAPESVTFRATDGLAVRGQFFRARGCAAPRRCPALVFIHGGPRRQMLRGFHPSAYYSRTYLLNQHLAARGFHVLSVNYRGGTGYGLRWRDAAETGREGASEYRDVLAAGRWLAAQPSADSARIGVWGGSWGGYLAALALARDSALFAGGVDLHGVHSLLRPVANTLSPEAQERARRLQWDSSPLAAIDRWRSPVLLIHGDDDRNVPFAQSLLLARELAARGVPYEELVLPNERHGFFRHDNWLRAFRATEGFFERRLTRRP